jgi:hypothetical protein|tara:strand:+ start:129 stop:407 length:279 start_codon:yes stop_codon:yes gene_type:complete
MIWDDFFRDTTYNRHYINRNANSNWYLNMWSELMEAALDEAVPVEKPKTKIVSTKTVKRNGKTYRITVEQILPEETDNKSDNFDTDSTNGIA